MGGPSSLIWIIALGVTALMVIVHIAIWFGIKKLGQSDSRRNSKKP